MLLADWAENEEYLVLHREKWICYQLRVFLAFTPELCKPEFQETSENIQIKFVPSFFAEFRGRMSSNNLPEMDWTLRYPTEKPLHSG